jgi:hypothetical protein
MIADEDRIAHFGGRIDLDVLPDPHHLPTLGAGPLMFTRPASAS